MTIRMMIAVLLIDGLGIIAAGVTYFLVDNKKLAIIPIIITTLVMGLLPVIAKRINRP